jgi:DNA-binding NtrC family response regulator
MRQGAVDYISKPFDHEELVQSINRIIGDHQRKKLATIEDDQPLLGNSPDILHILKTIRKSAPTAAPILILGASGCGKRVIAKTIHNAGASSDKPFITINCATTGEDQLKKTHRLAEEGNIGSLFLSNIDELPMVLQKTMCNLVKDKSLRCVASAKTDLKERCEQDEFREDLLFAISVVIIKVPALRERSSDIPQLTDYFLDRFSAELGIQVEISPEGMNALIYYDWPGNVRELKNTLYQASILVDPETLISAAMLGLASEDRTDTQVVHKNGSVIPAATHLSLEDYFINFVLDNQAHMCETALAEKLGISRKSLWQRRRKLGISRSKA